MLKMINLTIFYSKRPFLVFNNSIIWTNIRPAGHIRQHQQDGAGQGRGWALRHRGHQQPAARRGQVSCH